MRRCLWLILPLLVACSRQPPAAKDQSAKPTTVQKTGQCDNVLVPAGSRCELDGVSPLACSDCAPGEGLYRISHRVTVGGRAWTFRTEVVKAPEARLQELRRLLESNSPVGCSGTVVNPPCNPQGTSVALDLPWPEWVKIQRGW